MYSFKHQYTLITGASSGIGEAIAYRLAALGSDLLLVGRNLERLQRVAERCRALGAAATVACVDMNSAPSIDAFADQILAADRPFDCILLNAGISQRSKALETDMQVDRDIMQTNLFGPVQLAKRLAPHLRSHRTRIAVTSSISGLFGFPLRSAYCASKHAQFGFFESLELENPTVSVTFLIPGRIRTDISRSAKLGDGSNYGQMDNGQQNGMSVERCARIAVRAIARGNRRKLIGGKELIMVYLKRWCPPLFFILARRVNPR